MPLPEKPEEIGNAGRPAAQTPRSGAAVATLEPQSMHPVSLLMAEHRVVEAMFGSIHASADPGLRADLAGRLLRELEQHMQVEEELFYPAVERAAALGHALRHARHEHDAIRERIAQVAQAGSDGGALGEAIDALEASVAQHVREEEAELFPQVEGIALDWTEVGIAIAGRREQLRGGPAP